MYRALLNHLILGQHCFDHLAIVRTAAGSSAKWLGRLKLSLLERALLPSNKHATDHIDALCARLTAAVLSLPPSSLCASSMNSTAFRANITLNERHLERTPRRTDHGGIFLQPPPFGP